MPFFKRKTADARSEKKKVRPHPLLGLIFVAALLFFFFARTSFYTVKTGYAGVVTRFGRVLTFSDPGFHVKAPLIDKVIPIETREHVYYFGGAENPTPLEVSTKDMQSVKVEFAVQAAVTDPLLIYTKFGELAEFRFIRPRVQEVVQSTIARYTIEEFVSKRQEISKAIFNDLKDDFGEYKIVVSNISITNHDFSDDYEKAVEEKKIAEQQVEKTRFEQEKLRVEQENKVKLAELEVQRKKLEAEANEALSKTLSKSLLEKMFIEKWDGKLPLVSGSKDLMIDPSSLLEEAKSDPTPSQK